MVKQFENYVWLGIIIVIVSAGILGVDEMQIVSANFVWEMITFCASLGILLVIIFYALWGVCIMGGLLIKGVSNVRKYNGKGNFSEIDRFTRCYGENAGYYKNQIRAINYAYSEGIVAKEYVDKKALDVLYERKDFLESQMNFYNEFVNVFVSLGISALAGLLSREEALSTIATIELIIGLMFAAVGRYAFRGQAGSFGHYAHGYELEKINEGLKKIWEDDLECNEEEIKVIGLQQDILVSLMELIKNRFKQMILHVNKKDIEKDIEVIYHIDFLDKVKEKGLLSIETNINGNYYRIPMKADENGNLEAYDENYKKLLDIIEKYKL